MAWMHKQIRIGIRKKSIGENKRDNDQSKPRHRWTKDNFVYILCSVENAILKFGQLYLYWWLTYKQEMYLVANLHLNIWFIFLLYFKVALLDHGSTQSCKFLTGFISFFCVLLGFQEIQVSAWGVIRESFKKIIVI